VLRQQPTISIGVDVERDIRGTPGYNIGTAEPDRKEN